jgi:lipid II:glycine glycyltransferase (peptidoglycan interpeptide bridge formation enzyme)
MRAELESQGFIESRLAIAPEATVRIDLEQSPEDLFGRMRKKAQRNIQKARRLGLVIREAGAADLQTFGKLATDTARRQTFSPYPFSYYEHTWNAFAARDHARLFVAEHEGVALASFFIIGFADTVTYKYGGWSGSKKNVPPNELLHWTAMNWAKQRGYRYYDFADIYPGVAQAVLAGRELSPEVSGYTRFKLNFGGEVLLFPGAFDYGVLRRLAPPLERLRPLVSRIVGRGSVNSSDPSVA